jgi:hypothetical protein
VADYEGSNTTTRISTINIISTTTTITTTTTTAVTTTTTTTNTTITTITTTSNSILIYQYAKSTAKWPITETAKHKQTQRTTDIKATRHA